MPTRHRNTTLLLAGLVSALVLGGRDPAGKLLQEDMQIQVLRTPFVGVKVLHAIPP